MFRFILMFWVIINVAYANGSLTEHVARAGHTVVSQLSSSPMVMVNDANDSKFIIDQIWFQITPNVTFQVPGGIVQLTVTPVVEFFFKKKLPAGYVLYRP